MRIKRNNNGNEYLLTEYGAWVRDFTKRIVPVDINTFTDKTDFSLIVENEIKNSSLDLSEMDADKIKINNAIIVSDGYDFDNKQNLLTDIPKDVVIIATNKSLVKWKINRKIDYFIVNNPYSDCMLMMPKHNYLPACVASTRTYHEFLRQYDLRNGVIYKYTSVQEQGFSPRNDKLICSIDDYRNPICAAIGLAWKLSVKKLLLFCCDSSFISERPSAEQLPNNNLWTYPQQKISHSLIEANLFWYQKQKVKLGDHSSGPIYKNVPYVMEKDIPKFFSNT
jgi:hypothetical protein